MSINASVLRSSTRRGMASLQPPHRTTIINTETDKEYEDESDHEPDELNSNHQPNARVRPPTKTRTKRSYVWMHGNHVEVLEKPRGEEKRRWKEKWQCGKCMDVFYAPSTTVHIKDHLRDVHGLTSIVTRRAIFPGEVAQVNSTQTPFDPARMKKALVAWFTTDHVPFLQVESEQWRNFMSTASSDILNWLPKCADTPRKWTMDVFDEKKRELSTILSKVPSRIHVSFDAYTSPNCLALLGIVGHWSDECGHFKRALLGLKEIDGRHTGENLAKIVRELFEGYGLQSDQIGWYILDNATNNDTTLEVLLGDDNLPFRLRCVGHIFNLTVKALLSMHHNDDDDDNDDDDVLPAKWKRLSGIEKLHALAKCILNNPQWKKLFREMDDFEKMIKSDNKTRWSSVDNMIASVLNRNLVVDRFVRDMARRVKNKSKREKIEAMLLTTEEWEQLAELHKILAPFRDLSVKLQGIFPSLFC